MGGKKHRGRLVWGKGTLNRRRALHYFRARWRKRLIWEGCYAACPSFRSCFVSCGRGRCAAAGGWPPLGCIADPQFFRPGLPPANSPQLCYRGRTGRGLCALPGNLLRGSIGSCGACGSHTAAVRFGVATQPDGRRHSNAALARQLAATAFRPRAFTGLERRSIAGKRHQG